MAVSLGKHELLEDVHPKVVPNILHIFLGRGVGI